MKRKILLAFIAATITICSLNAQIKKGSLFVGGDVGFDAQALESRIPGFGRTMEFFSFSPAAAIAIKDNMLVGGDLRLGADGHNFNGALYSRCFTAGVGFFLKPYLPIVNRLYLFGHARLGVSYVAVRSGEANPHGSARDRGYNISLTLHPGLSYAISKSVRLECGVTNFAWVAFSHLKYTNAIVEDKTNVFLNGSWFNHPAGGFIIGCRVRVKN